MLFRSLMMGRDSGIVIGELSTVGPDGHGVTGLAQRIDLAVSMTGAILFGLRLYNSPRYADPQTEAAAG